MGAGVGGMLGAATAVFTPGPPPAHLPSPGKPAPLPCSPAHLPGVEVSPSLASADGRPQHTERVAAEQSAPVAEPSASPGAADVRGVAGSSVAALQAGLPLAPLVDPAPSKGNSDHEETAVCVAAAAAAPFSSTDRSLTDAPPAAQPPPHPPPLQLRQQAAFDPRACAVPLGQPRGPKQPGAPDAPNAAAEPLAKLQRRAAGAARADVQLVSSPAPQRLERAELTGAGLAHVGERTSVVTVVKADVRLTLVPPESMVASAHERRGDDVSEFLAAADDPAAQQNPAVLCECSPPAGGTDGGQLQGGGEQRVGHWPDLTCAAPVANDAAASEPNAAAISSADAADAAAAADTTSSACAAGEESTAQPAVPAAEAVAASTAAPAASADAVPAVRPAAAAHAGLGATMGALAATTNAATAAGKDDCTLQRVDHSEAGAACRLAGSKRPFEGAAGAPDDGADGERSTKRQAAGADTGVGRTDGEREIALSMLLQVHHLQLQMLADAVCLHAISQVLTAQRRCYCDSHGLCWAAMQFLVARHEIMQHAIPRSLHL